MDDPDIDMHRKAATWVTTAVLASVTPPIAREAWCLRTRAQCGLRTQAAQMRCRKSENAEHPFDEDDYEST
ncbi:hypothetical protein [Paraburkholderia sp. BL17N1]|uniref:hypothetical protein n=1 Tax=Paraburkholderia sp. BL17N1 TaxID=1938798 RepID=UPI000F0E4151|nr:hypothetical protein [Paraburkholderia sp. BL17N1]RKR43759.1 hypothetical protein B0G82_1337 [Paraburkholderia sp. BL17N1]